MRGDVSSATWSHEGGGGREPAGLLSRRLALLGGTTTLGDCMAALGYLANPRRLVQGPAIADYEEAFARYVGVRHAYSFSTGRVGLYGALRTLGIGAGDDVLLQVPTHIVVPNAIRFAGARPVYVDCELDTYNMDLEEAERKITSRTKALVLQHTFGIPVDMDAALALARRHGLEVIEDCVHALGATWAGRQVGSFGRVAFFSTEETKIISSTMGGMVTTDDSGLAATLRAFQESCAPQSFSQTFRYVLKLVVYHLLTQPHVHRYAREVYERTGRRQPLSRATSGEEMRGVRPADYEQRLSNGQAAVALRQLRRLDANLAHRRACARGYRERLATGGIGPLRLPAKADPAYVRYPVWVADQTAALRTTAPYLVLGTWFDSVLEEAASPAHGGYEMGSCPRAEESTKHLVNLPTHLRVTLRDVAVISEAVSRARGIGGLPMGPGGTR